MEPLFQLPEELLSTLAQDFPCREPQIRALSTLLHPSAAPCRNLVIHGTEATAKSAVVEALLRRLTGGGEGPPGSPGSQTLQYAIVNSIECVTGRHLFERTVGKVADAVSWKGTLGRCETLSQLTVELSKMLKYVPRPEGSGFVLVFDAIDRQREAPPTLLPALGRLSEIIPSLTTVFIVTSPPPNLLRTSSVPHVHFPNYTKPEFVAILSSPANVPPTLPTTTAQETAELWSRFCAAVHDALTRAAARTLPAYHRACAALWPRFTAPILAGTHGAREFSKLLVAARVHFQDEGLLDPAIIAVLPAARGKIGGDLPDGMPPVSGTGSAARTAMAKPGVAAGTDLSTLLPTTARMLLLAAYLASHNATKHDLTLFSTYHHGRRRRGGGLSVSGGRASRGGHKHRKIARKLLGAHAFVLERMVAIFAAVRGEWSDLHLKSGGGGGGEGAAAGVGGAMDADVGMAIATLASLRLLTRVGVAGGGDVMDRGGKWRVNVGWEVVRGLGRSMGVEVEDWLID